MATASITGHVTASTTGQPLQGATVTLTGSMTNPLTAVTDDDGDYDIVDVPAGSYTLAAASAGYLTMQYGQLHPREAARRIRVGAGEVDHHLDIALARGAVVAGRIRDKQGGSYARARVEVMEPRVVNGHRIAVAAGIATTDASGAFRIGGLNPGTYTVRASATDTWDGDSDRLGTFAYSMTYFPGAAASDRATAIVVAEGQEIANIDFALAVGRAARVAGRVENASGERVRGLAVNLSRITRAIGGAPLSSGPFGSGRTRADGSFEIGRVPPGEYVLSATLSPTESTAQTVWIAEADLTGIVLTLRAARPLSGSVVTDDDTAPPVPAARLQIDPVPGSNDNALPALEAARPQTVNADWSFRFADMNGRYLFRMIGLPENWMLQSVVVNGRDVTDVPLDIAKGAASTTAVRMVISQNGASVSGSVLDAHGAPLADSTVVVFAADSARWGPGTRFVRATRPDLEGRFLVAGLPAATYLVTARDFIADGDWDDPVFLRGVVPGATSVTLTTGTTQDVQLTVDMR